VGKNRALRVTSSAHDDAVYGYLTEEALPPGRDIHVDLPDERTGGRSVVKDWRDSKLVGLEVLDARELLHQDLLNQAEIIG
jgi:hypothetical protein